MTTPRSPVLSADAALARLREGNARFLSRQSELAHQGWRPGLAAGQWPFAVILGCSDSRAPAEFVFDQGLGDLFVIRVAGNIVAPSGVGSVEFAAAQFETPLVVVMGHTHCGAVKATIEEIASRDFATSRNLRAITDRIRPFIEPLMQKDSTGSLEERVLDATRANVRAAVSQLRHGSQLLEDLIIAGRLRVVGAVYDLDSGRVDFLDSAETR